MSDTDGHGTVLSADVEIFYRRFGAGGSATDAPSGAPVLILHGAGYYDSADWVTVARALSHTREVVAYDARGYGRSGWSPSGDYSVESQMRDITALLDGLGWERPVLLGHSRGGSFALRYAATAPERVGALIFADSCPGRTARGPVGAGSGSGSGSGSGGSGGSGVGSGGSGGGAEPVYTTLEAALASTSRDPGSLADPAKRSRLEEIFVPVDGGFRLALRDPAFGQGGGGPSFDGWAALAAIDVPTLFIRAERSLSFDDAAWARVHSLAPGGTFAEIDAGHDLANEAPDELIATVANFLASLA